MTQPANKRFVMHSTLDAVEEQINDALDDKVDLTDPRLTDQRVPLDNSVTSAKIANGAIVDEDVNASAAIAKTKIAGTAVTQADTGTVTSTMIANGTVTGTDIASGTVTETNLATLDYVKFDTTYAGGSTQPGMLAWDQANETLQFQLDPHVTLQVGQEHVMRVKNASGTVAIPERTVVMFAGATGDTIKVSPAVSNGSVNVNYLAGITTEEIPADGFGFVTQLGFINQTNTNGWAVGTILYADPTVAGGLTPTEPELPAWTMPIAAVTKQSTSAGRMLVRAIPGGSGAGGSSVVISDTVPAGGTKGDLWLDSTEGTLYIYFEDADSSQWVQVKANSALEGSILERLGALESQAIAYGRPSYNYVINGAFDINQRGFTSTTTNNAYGFDRFGITAIDGTTTYSAQTFVLGSEPVQGYGAVKYARLVTNGQTLSTAQSRLNHRIEDVRTLAGKTVTVSFWARAASGSPTIAVSFSQIFGTGGSSAVETVGGYVTISTSWQRYSVTASLPSISSGSTIGDNNHLLLTFLVSAGSAITLAPSLGIQSNTFDFWGVQLEEGSVATAFRRNSPNIQAELAACQRYFYNPYYEITAPYVAVGPGYTISNTTGRVTIKLPVSMRIPPSITGVAPNNFYLGYGNLGANWEMSVMTLTTATKDFILLEVSNPFAGMNIEKPCQLYRPGTTGMLPISAEL